MRNEHNQSAVGSGKRNGANTRTAGGNFAPSDPFDGREPGDWKSRYPEAARKWICIEALYLMIIFCLVFIWIALILISKKYTHIGELELGAISSGLGGLLGGTIFSIKWLYHAVARGIWHEDRRLWRFWTPWISLGLAFVFWALISSGLLKIFDPAAMSSKWTTFSLGFLIGYFSDAATAKLSEVANTLFGVVRNDHSKK